MSMLSPRYRPPDGPLRLPPCIVHRTLPIVIFFHVSSTIKHMYAHIRTQTRLHSQTHSHTCTHTHTHRERHRHMKTHTLKHSSILSHALAHIDYYLLDCIHPRLADPSTYQFVCRVVLCCLLIIL